MSRIDQLIQELCPDGVRIATLDELCEVANNKRKPVKSSLRTSGTTPYYGANNIQDYVEGYTHNGEYVLIAEDGSASLSNYSVQFAIGRFWANNHVHVVRGKDGVDNRFLFHFFSAMNFIPFLTGGTRAKLNKSKLLEIKIPIPPLEVQKEIARILDKFTQLEAELSVELEARLKQYEYYRNQLYGDDFNSYLKHKIKPEVKKMRFSELGTLTRGRRFVKDDILDQGFPCIHYGEMYTHYGISATETKSFISYELAAKLRVARTGDVVIVAAGETVEDIGNGVAWLGDSNVVIHDACYIFHHSLEPKYVSYFLRTSNFHAQIKRSISTGKISSISSKGLEKVLIPVPPLDVQWEIVGILDKFELLVGDPLNGLPAEINARRKQYEYYRTKLLTFQELPS